MNFKTSTLILILVAFVIALALAYYLGKRNNSKRETFDSSKIKDPKVRSEMEYLKKMYFS
jgi:preprotein translocase subunit SecG